MEWLALILLPPTFGLVAFAVLWLIGITYSMVKMIKNFYHRVIAKKPKKQRLEPQL